MNTQSRSLWRTMEWCRSTGRFWGVIPALLVGIVSFWPERVKAEGPKQGCCDSGYVAHATFLHPDPKIGWMGIMTDVNLGPDRRYSWDSVQYSGIVVIASGGQDKDVCVEVEYSGEYPGAYEYDVANYYQWSNSGLPAGWGTMQDHNYYSIVPGDWPASDPDLIAFTVTATSHDTGACNVGAETKSDSITIEIYNCAGCISGTSQTTYDKDCANCWRSDHPIFGGSPDWYKEPNHCRGTPAYHNEECIQGSYNPVCEHIIINVDQQCDKEPECCEYQLIEYFIDDCVPHEDKETGIWTCECLPNFHQHVHFWSCNV